ncbi:SMI1/KNR4 family protein [Metabacillus fastidiosus]|uniref:SMI1/KNR4 family protein n=1 Tax=Metabacillus fastidiosus TaxID=1458 RepID=UPI002E1AE07A|nr:SMI1/KNR4 family protein [Metabacillus fastidiosus]
MDHWTDMIAVMMSVKQEMQKYDKEKLWGYYLPETAAAESKITEAENCLGFFLDPYYKEFLKHANGWKGFSQTIDLFGTEELCQSEDMKYANMILNAIENSVIEESSFSRDQLLPIAATKTDKDLFVLTKWNKSSPRIVIWFAGEEVERFDNFKQFFLAMIDYNKDDLDYLKDHD